MLESTKNEKRELRNEVVRIRQELRELDAGNNTLNNPFHRKYSRYVLSKYSLFFFDTASVREGETWQELYNKKLATESSLLTNSMHRKFLKIRFREQQRVQEQNQNFCSLRPILKTEGKRDSKDTIAPKVVSWNL
jgi:hypothetical protein